jgi:hypothetical protein
MELKWDVRFNLTSDLCVCFAGGKSNRKNQGNERQKQVAFHCTVAARVSHFDWFSSHDEFSFFLPLHKASVPCATKLE